MTSPATALSIDGGALGREVPVVLRLILGLLFDDPTSGLDPITSRTVVDEIIKLRDLERVTSVLVTHQLPDAYLKTFLSEWVPPLI